jgi:hypothetical protein
MTNFVEKMKLFFSDVWVFLGPFIEILLTGAGQILAQAAMDAVAQVAKDPSILNDRDKRDAAFGIIQQQIFAKGLTMATSTINAALEAAVVRLKADKP